MVQPIQAQNDVSYCIAIMETSMDYYYTCNKYVVKMLPKSQTLQARYAGFRWEHLCGLSTKVTHDDV